MKRYGLHKCEPCDQCQASMPLYHVGSLECLQIHPKFPSLSPSYRDFTQTYTVWIYMKTRFCLAQTSPFPPLFRQQTWCSPRWTVQSDSLNQPIRNDATVKLNHFPRFPCENKKCLKPPHSFFMEMFVGFLRCYLVFSGTLFRNLIQLFRRWSHQTGFHHGVYDYNLTCWNGQKAYLTYFLTSDVIIFGQSFLAGRHEILCIEGGL